MAEKGFQSGKAILDFGKSGSRYSYNMFIFLMAITATLFVFSGTSKTSAQDPG